MANAEMYDFLITITPDYNSTLSILPQGSITEESSKNQIIHVGVDGSEERVSFNTTPIFFINFEVKALSESDAGTIFDWYNDSSKANGKLRTFKYDYGDGHTYVVRFDSNLSRRGPRPSLYGISNVRLKVLGRVAD